MGSLGRLIWYECRKLWRGWMFAAALFFCLAVSLLYQEREMRGYHFWYDTDERRAVWERGSRMELEEALEWAAAESAWYDFLVQEKASFHSEEDTRLFWETLKEGVSSEWQREFERRWQNVDNYPQEELERKLYSSIYGFLSLQLEYIQSYEEWAGSLQRQIEAGGDNPLIDRESFAYRSSLRRLEELRKQSGRTLALDYPLAVDLGTKAPVPDLFVPLLAALAAWLALGADKERGTEGLLGSARNGGRALSAARAAACLIVTVLGALILYGGSLLFTMILCGGAGRLDAPIQSLREFRDCRYAISAGTYLAAYLGLKLSGAALFALFALALCVLAGRTAWFVPVYGGALWGEYWLAGRGVWWNLFSFQDAGMWFRSYRDLNLLGRPLDPLWGLFWSFLFFAAALGGIYMAFSERRAAFRIPSLRFGGSRIGKAVSRAGRAAGKSGRGGRASLFVQEAYKLYLLGGGGLCLAFLLIYAGALSLDEARYSVQGTEGLYNYYIRGINGGFYGGYTEEAAGRLQDFKDWFAGEDEEALDVEASYAKGLLSLTDYEDWKQLRYAGQVQRREAFRLILEQEEAVGRAQAWAGKSRPEKCGFVSLYLAKALLEDFREQTLLYLMLGAALCLALPALHGQEAESGMRILLQTADRRRLRRCKHIQCLLYTTVVFLLMYLPYLAWQWRRIGPWEGLGAYIQCIPGYEEIPLPLTVGGAILLAMAARYVSACLMAACLAALGEWCGSGQMGRIAGCLLFLAPGILYLTGVDISRYTLLGGFLLPALWGSGGGGAVLGQAALSGGICILLAGIRGWKGVKGNGIGD